MDTKKVMPAKAKDRYHVHFFLNGTEVVKDIPVVMEDAPGVKEIRIVLLTHIAGELYGTAGVKVVAWESLEEATKILDKPELYYKKK